MDRTLALIKSRAHVLKDFSGPMRAFFTEQFEYETAAVARFLQDRRLRALIPELLGRYEAAAVFTPESTERELRDFAQAKGIKAAILINALRVGLTGQGVAPGLFEVIQVLGREPTLHRMRRLARYCAQTLEDDAPTSQQG
jgi:glutamyl/glutaminyl-tRNA synthetase